LENLQELLRGPLFRLSFALMILGLMRILFLTVFEAFRAYIKAGDKQLPWKDIILRTINWFLPFNRLFRRKPLYSVISFIFHIGLILTPLFLFAHIQLWRGSLGIGWPALPRSLADILTLTAIFSAAALLIGRTLDKTARVLSRKQDFIWPAVILIPFITGYLCSNTGLGAKTYQYVMLIHIFSAEVIFIMIPFTKTAHCILFPLSILVSNLGWKFPADAGERTAVSLKKEGLPV